MGQIDPLPQESNSEEEVEEEQEQQQAGQAQWTGKNGCQWLSHPEENQPTMTLPQRDLHPYNGEAASCVHLELHARDARKPVYTVKCVCVRITQICCDKCAEKVGRGRK